PPPLASPSKQALYYQEFDHAVPGLLPESDTDADIVYPGAASRQHTAGALRIRSEARGRVSGKIPHPRNLILAEDLVVRVRGEKAPVTFQVRFSSTKRRAFFWRRVRVEAAAWEEHRLPLRYFAWSYPSVPTWEDVDHLVLELESGGSLLVDRLEL